MASEAGANGGGIISYGYAAHLLRLRDRAGALKREGVMLKIGEFSRYAVVV